MNSSTAGWPATRPCGPGWMIQVRWMPGAAARSELTTGRVWTASPIALIITMATRARPRSGGGTVRGPSADGHEHAPLVVHARVEAAQGHAGGGRADGARAHVEARAVPLAGEDAVLHLAAVQRQRLVRAETLQGVDLAVDLAEHDLLAAH